MYKRDGNQQYYSFYLLWSSSVLHGTFCRFFLLSMTLRFQIFTPLLQEVELMHHQFEQIPPLWKRSRPPEIKIAQRRWWKKIEVLTLRNDKNTFMHAYWKKEHTVSLFSEEKEKGKQKGSPWLSIFPPRLFGMNVKLKGFALPLSYWGEMNNFKIKEDV